MTPGHRHVSLAGKHSSTSSRWGRAWTPESKRPGFESQLWQLMVALSFLWLQFIHSRNVYWEPPVCQTLWQAQGCNDQQEETQCLPSGSQSNSGDPHWINIHKHKTKTKTQYYVVKNPDPGIKMSKFQVWFFYLLASVTLSKLFHFSMPQFHYL